MIPAPAQGDACCCHGERQFYAALCTSNDIETEIATYIERQFLKTLEGGCTRQLVLWHAIMKRKIQFIFKAFYFRRKRKIEVDKLFLSKNGRNWDFMLLKSA
jgi:hydroxymethylbilane synthase